MSNLIHVKHTVLDTTDSILNNVGDLNTLFRNKPERVIPDAFFKSWDHERKMVKLKELITLLKVFGLLRVTSANALGLLVSGTLYPVKVTGGNLSAVFIPDIAEPDVREPKTIADMAFRAVLIHAVVYNDTAEQQEQQSVQAVGSALWTAKAHPAVAAYRFYRDNVIDPALPELLIEYSHTSSDGSQYTSGAFRYAVETVNGRPAPSYNPSKKQNWVLMKPASSDAWRVYATDPQGSGIPVLVTDDSLFGMAMEDLRTTCSDILAKTAPDHGAYL